MGDLLVWLVLGSFFILLFCIYSLSSQLERCIRLAVDIITGNQRKILQQLEALNKAPSPLRSPDVVPFDVVSYERRVQQRRRRPGAGAVDDRRELRGRRHEDQAMLERV